MAQNLVWDLLLRGIPIEGVLLLIVITAGIYGLVHLVMYIRYQVSKRQFIKEQQNEVNQTIYALAVAMVKADGRVDREELVVAESIGKKIFDGFSSSEFRRLCKNNKTSSDVRRIAIDMGRHLTKDGKNIMLSYLHEISMADGRIDAKEEKLLRSIAKVWGIELPEVNSESSLSVSELAYSLAASVITADGVIDDVELETASNLAKLFIDDFDSEALHQVCLHPDLIPSPHKLCKKVANLLTDEGKVLLLRYLGTIAASSEGNKEAGDKLVQQLSTIWEVEPDDYAINQ